MPNSLSHTQRPRRHDATPRGLVGSPSVARAASTCSHAAQSPSAQSPSRFLQRRSVRRRSGVALVYTALGLAVFIGATGLVVDMGRLYTRRAQAQNAADSAALAGAYELNNGATQAEAEAKKYAASNGYGEGEVETKVFTSKGRQPDSITVFVRRREPLFFIPAMAALLGRSTTSSLVGARATARASFAQKPIDTPMSLGAEYGAVNGFANPSVFGQDARYNYGDAYSPLYMGDGKTPNKGPEGDPRGADFNGYEYTLKVDSDFSSRNGTPLVQMEIFDPDSYVEDTANMLASWDEQHPDANGNSQDTQTTYTLLAPKTDPKDADVVIAQATYGADASTNLKWTTPDGFTFDTSRYGAGNYTLRVKGGRGTSENGFQLRAGKPHKGLDTEAGYEEWKRDYNFGGAGNGTSFSSRGKAVLNFTLSGPVEINLGFVPKKADKVFIDKFDTDVGFQSIEYYYLKKDGTKVDAGPGTQAADGQWAPTDVLNVPSDYPEDGASWYVKYKAGAYDTSNWKMGYSDPTLPASGPGSVKLID